MRMIAFLALAAASVAVPAAAQTKAAADPNKSVCKTHTETGSLAKRIRECHTVAEWQQMSENGRKDADTYRDVMNSSRGGN